MVQKAAILAKSTKPRRGIACSGVRLWAWAAEKPYFKRFSGIEKCHRNSIKITVALWRRVRDSNPRFLLGTQHFESSCQNRTWRNLTEDNGRWENPENAVFSRLSAPLCIENAVKIRVRESPPISPSSNGFSEKPIRIFDRTERFFAPKSRFWQCVKSTGYAEPHQKSCRQMPVQNQNFHYR